MNQDQRALTDCIQRSRRLIGERDARIAELQTELDRLNAYGDAALEYLNMEDGQKDAFKELRRAFGLVNRFVCTGCGHIQTYYTPCMDCPKCGEEMNYKVVKERPTHGGSGDE